MASHRTILGTIAIAAFGAAPGVLSAQSSTAPHKPATAAIAGIARAPEPARDNRDHDGDHDRHGRSEHRHDGYSDRYDRDGIRVGHVFFGPEVPVVVGSDGHVYANFGYGFQPVLENCATTQYPALTAAPAAAPTVQPHVTQPVVVQPGAAPSTAAQGGGSVARLGVAPSTVCWATDDRGLLRVGRR